MKICKNAYENQASLGEVFWSLLVPLGRLRLHFGCHLNSGRVERASQYAPEGPQNEPKDARRSKVERNGTETEQKASWRLLKGSQRQPKWSEPKRAKREPRKAKGYDRMYPKSQLKKLVRKSMPPKYDSSVDVQCKECAGFWLASKLVSWKTWLFEKGEPTQTLIFMQ